MCEILYIYCHWMFKPPAVNEQGMSLFSENGHKLIHYTTGHASVSVFCLLTAKCFGHIISIICEIYQINQTHFGQVKKVPKIAASVVTLTLV